MSSNFHSALEDFRNARQQAALQTVVSWLTGRSNELLSYEETISGLKAQGRTERGLQNVPIDAIVGTVGRYTDFTRSFLPLQSNDAERWAHVQIAARDGAGLPPVELYQVGDAYFVRDGHHRISVAKQEGATHIDAFVIEVNTLVPLASNDEKSDLILKAEYADFLELTHLNETHPEADLLLTEPGQYKRLLEYIEAHQYCLRKDQKKEYSLSHAAAHWYDEGYLPLVDIVREHGLLRYFPRRSEADFYLWIAEHRDELAQTLGWQVSLAGAAEDWISQQAKEVHVSGDGQLSKANLTENNALFPDLLLPLSDTSQSWVAFEQAKIIAQREAGQIHGLHILTGKSQQKNEQAQDIQTRFNQQCQAANIPASFTIENGQAARKICDRALLTDLLVLPVAHPPQEKSLTRLASGLRNIILQCARPMLTVQDEVSQFKHGLLAYDGSPKADEALFLAAYLAQRWQSKITVVSALHQALPAEVQNRPRAYFELHGVEADFVSVRGQGELNARELMKQVYRDHDCDFILMGAYSVTFIKEMRLGSLVDTFLHEMGCPIFICR